MRVMVLGNCQAWGMAACLARRRPDWQVESVFVGAMATIDEARALARTLGAFDLIVAQPIRKARYRPLHLDRLEQRARRLVRFPQVTYTGLHPDVIKLVSEKGRVPAPTGTLSSRIAAASFVLGLTPERAVSMFNAYVYGRLGYFDEPAQADRFQVSLGREAGVDLAPLIAAWRALGVFMHHPLHPKIAVSDSLAALVLRTLGEDEGAAAGLPPDPLADDTVWPVYPELARRLGVAGWTEFRTKAGEVLPLEAMVARSYRLYQEFGVERLTDPDLLATVETLKTKLS